MTEHDPDELTDYDRGYRDGQTEVIVSLIEALQSGASLAEWLEDLRARDIRRRLSSP